MATVASISIFPSMTHHPVGLAPTTRNNPLVQVNLSAIPAAYVAGTPAIKANAQNIPTVTEHFALCQFTSQVELTMTGPGLDPLQAGQTSQSVLWIAGVTSYGVVMPPGYNEIHVRPLV